MTRRKSTAAWSGKHLSHIPAIKRALSQPMVGEILETIDQNRGSVFYILALAQVFKSLVGQLRALRSMQVEPQPSLWYGPTEQNVGDFVEEKFGPLMANCPAITSILFDDPKKTMKQRIIYPSGAYFLLLSAGADSNRQSKTACDLYFDEPWLYEPGWIGECQRRHGDYPQDYREMFMTTGPTAGTHAARIWENTDQRRWHMCCPGCGAFIEPRFAHKNESGDIIGGVRFETVLRADGLPDEAAIQHSTTYECPKCHKSYPDSPGSRLALNGTADLPKGRYIAQNASPSPRHFGWQVNGCAVREWGPLATKFVYAQLARERGDLSPMEEIVRLDFADIWDDQTYFVQKSVRPTGDYRMGDPWAEELADNYGRPFRFATVDVQQDGYYLVIRGWGRYSESRCILAAYVMSPSDIECLCRDNRVEPFRVFMDARFEPQRVRRIATMKGWHTLMGDKQNNRGYKHPDGIQHIYDEPRFHDPLIGTPEQGQGKPVMEVLFSKQAALNRLWILRNEKYQPRRAEGQTEDPQPRHLWTAADNMPDAYWAQVEAHYRKKIVSADGSEHFTWVGFKEDHYGDCEAMQIVVASMAGLTGAESITPAVEAQK